jgi:hypothetical protein
MVFGCPPRCEDDVSPQDTVNKVMQVMSDVAAVFKYLVCLSPNMVSITVSNIRFCNGCITIAC